MRHAEESRPCVVSLPLVLTLVQSEQEPMAKVAFQSAKHALPLQHSQMQMFVAWRRERRGAAIEYGGG